MVHGVGSDASRYSTYSDYSPLSYHQHRPPPAHPPPPPPRPPPFSEEQQRVRERERVRCAKLDERAEVQASLSATQQWEALRAQVHSWQAVAAGDA